MTVFQERCWTVLISSTIGVIIFLFFRMVTLFLQPYVLWMRIDP